MDLQSVTLNGWRRFARPTELKTNGKLVALLGPNEAGKTSILSAISLIGSGNPISKSDLARSAVIADDQIVIGASFRLDADDLLAAQIDRPTSYILEKNAAGKQSHKFDPPIRERDTAPRRKAHAILERSRRNNKLWGRLVQDDDGIAGKFDAAAAMLTSAKETLDETELATLKELREAIQEQSLSADPAYFRDLGDKLFELLDTESLPTPSTIAFSVIYKRLPKFLLFSNDDRLLKGSYTLTELNDAIPPALENIAKVSGLDLQAMIAFISEGDTPNITRLKSLANDELKRRFQESWSQSGVRVAFEVMNEEIQILIQEENYNFTKLAERSDGLRQFVALQAFTTCERAENPVLLIDEAEMRLHYDAQADLIQMLSRQKVSSKILYTTHSAGCLPEDLGNGVRLVDYDNRDEDRPTSIIKNHFWSREGGGLEPLLFGMGATTLAFFPIRRALLTEGESDMLLLPTMFRESFNSTHLDFQIVPGLSKTSGINLPILARNGNGIAFALDFDQGGKELEKKIVGAGFDGNAIFYLKGSSGSECQLEDFINTRLLANAAHAAFATLGTKAQPITASAFKANGRLKTIAAHYGLKKSGEVPKVAIAYAILDSVGSNPDIRVLDSQKRRSFEKFARSVRAFLAR